MLDWIRGNMAKSWLAGISLAAFIVATAKARRRCL